MQRRASSLLMWLLPVLALGALASAARRGQPSVDGKLQTVLRELDDKNGQLREVMRDERRATQVISEIDEALVRAQQALADLERQQAALEVEVAELRSRVALDVASLDGLRQQVRTRLRALARVGGMSFLRVLLSSRSLHELALRRVLLARVAARDAGLLLALDQGQARLLSDRRLLEQRLSELRARREMAASGVEALQATRVERADALMQLGTRRGAIEARLEALRAARQRLQRLIWSQQAASSEQVGLALSRGHLPWPTAGRLELGYRAVAGAPAEAFSTGWTLRASLGTKVFAVAGGKVVHADFLRGYGLLVIVDHGFGFHTLCAHLSRAAVALGSEVAAGDLVGYLGDSESPDGPKLYFELRRNGRPLDPARWLAADPSAARPPQPASEPSAVRP
ncbi:MAG: peptidoglycan DD-metalloendopeptidase family protein [Deltaproteobacteria bacterium]|nr:peptidoglycan DD-metalloendopeptidase family protein [Deltaproteobacteria bacterium]